MGKKLFVAAAAVDAIYNVLTMCISNLVYLWHVMLSYTPHLPLFPNPSIAIDLARPLIQFDIGN